MEKSSAVITRRLAFWLILAVGAGLRLYRIDIPSLWWDEMLVPLTSSHSLAYIFDFCRHAEMHPPLYYLLVKAGMAFGVSDLALRLPTAIFGVASLWALYHVGARFTDKDTALAAMALLAVGGLHILVSREVRPYALLIFALVWVWYFLARLIERWRWADMAWLCAVNTGLLALHYFSVHLVFAQGAALVLGLAPGFNRGRLARLAVFAFWSLAAALPILWYFFLPSSGSRSIFTHTQYSRADVYSLIAEYLGQVLYFFDKGPLMWATAGLSLAGLAVLARSNRAAALSACCLAAVPLANVWVMGKAAYFSPWHVAYVAPMACLCAACALGLVFRTPGLRQALAVALALVLGANIAVRQYERYYQPESYKHMAFVTLYKLVARSLAGQLPGGDPVVCSQPGFAGGINWYLDQFLAPNPMHSQQVTPEQGELTLRFVSAFKDYGQLGSDEEAFLRNTSRPTRTDDAVNARVYTFAVSREPVDVLDKLPFEGGLKAGFLPFYTRVHRLQDAVYMPWNATGVTALRNDTPGVVEYMMENRAGSGPQTLFVNVMFSNTGRGNHLGVFYRFDDEPLEPLAGSIGPDRKHQAQAILRREKPYKRLLFRVELRCAQNSALYHGGNLETLALRDLQVYACVPEACAASQTLWERRNLDSLQQNYQGEGLASSSSIRQKRAEQASNIEDVSTGEVPGWRVFRPQDPDRPAFLQVELTPEEPMVFYPRVSGTQSVIQAWIVEPDGAKREVFWVCGVPELWSPIGARFGLELPKGDNRPKTLLIELRGRGSQIWHKDGLIFF